MSITYLNWFCKYWNYREGNILLKWLISTLILVYPNYRVISPPPNLPPSIFFRFLKQSWIREFSDKYGGNLGPRLEPNCWALIMYWRNWNLIFSKDLLFWRIFYVIKVYKRFEIYENRIFCWKCFILLMELELSQL